MHQEATTLTNLTIADAATLLRQRQISPLELTEAYLSRIEQINPRLNCFITLTAERALREARAAEIRIGKGDYLGPLDGIPLAYKDLFETRGIRTTAGSGLLKDNMPTADCTVVRRLREAGALCLGKLNMYEWAMKANNENATFGRCNNPWNLACSPGGSSGGSGAAVAAELCAASLGSDSGGSTRIPAALCGVVGLKPTYGRVSKYGVIPLSWSLDHVGLLAHTVSDLALLLQCCAGYDENDPSSRDIADETYLPQQMDIELQGWRVGLAYRHFFDGYISLNQEVLQATQAAGRVFEELGAKLSLIELPPIGELNSLILTSEAAAYHEQRLREHPEAFVPEVLESLHYGAARSAPEYARARLAQAQARRQFAQIFASYDILLTPTTPTPAPRYDASEAELVMRPSLTSFTAPFNFTGLPALSLPSGFSATGLPIGLQIIGRPWDEARILRAAYAYEQATGWHHRRPNLTTPDPRPKDAV